MKSFLPRFDILPAPQAAWRRCGILASSFTAARPSRCAWGTATRSISISSSLPLDRAALKRSLPWLASAAVLQDEPESLTVLSPGGVKVSFFGGLEVGRVAEPEVSEDGVVVAASLEDLLAFKLKLVVQRVEAKDYLDVAAVLRSGLSLERGLAAAEVLFAPDLPPMVVLKALTYFEGGDLSSLSAGVRATLCDIVARVGDLPVVSRNSDNLG